MVVVSEGIDDDMSKFAASIQGSGTQVAIRVDDVMQQHSRNVSYCGLLEEINCAASTCRMGDGFPLFRERFL